MKEITRAHKIAVIAGAGELPRLVIDTLKQGKSEFIVLALQGHADQLATKEQNCYDVHIGKVGTILKLLKQHKVKQIVFAGSVKRPSLLSLKLDATALLMLAKMGISRLSGGDDTILSTIIALSTKEGFEVCSPESIVPSMLVQPGKLGKIAPSASDNKDIAIGKKVLNKLGDMDVGQSAVVEDGCVLGIEAAEGTDQLILRCGKLKREKTRLGIVIKMKKSTQERRIDLPAIGTTTIQNLHDAGFKGIALEANSSLIINKKAVISLADKLGVFVVGV